LQRLLDGLMKLLAAPALDDRRRRPSELCSKYGPAVYRQCLRILGDEQAAGEATQAVLLDLARDARVLEALDEPAALLKRVYSAATSHCLDVLDTRGDLAACDGAV
jgi:DNA-directed RNA polymerase specialized sigma24 family protein